MKDKALNLSDVISRLQSLTKYEVSIGRDCECCGSQIEYDTDENGDWIKVEDLKMLIEELTVAKVFGTIDRASKSKKFTTRALSEQLKAFLEWADGQWLQMPGNWQQMIDEYEASR